MGLDGHVACRYVILMTKSKGNWNRLSSSGKYSKIPSTWENIQYYCNFICVWAFYSTNIFVKKKLIDSFGWFKRWYDLLHFTTISVLARKYYKKVQKYPRDMAAVCCASFCTSGKLNTLSSNELRTFIAKCFTKWQSEAIRYLALIEQWKYLTLRLHF